MNELSKVLNEYCRLFACDENQRRLSLWERLDEGIRWENQWHGLPSYDTSSGQSMPVTAECLDKIWEHLISLDMKKYYTDPLYYLEYYLKMRIEKFRRIRDDTPLTMDVPLVFGVTHEAGILGQKIYLDHGGEPSFSHEGIFDEQTVFPASFSFDNNPYLEKVVPFYRKMKQAAGEQFRILFPQWYRGPQGVALYVRGFQEFCLDLYLNEEFVHRLLRFITDTAKAYSLWRSDLTGEPIQKGDLFNDDITLISPDMYQQHILPYELELSEFFGGIFYWHSCGDVSPYISKVQKLPAIDLLDFGVSMDNKEAGLKQLDRSQAIEFRVMAQTRIQECSSEDAKQYVLGVLNLCEKYDVKKYILRSSGMSVVHGAQQDLDMLASWVDMVKELQSERCTKEQTLQ